MRRFMVLCLVLAGCGGDGGGRDRATPPTAPATNDPAYQGPTTRYALTGDALTPATSALPLPFTLTGGGAVEVWLDGQLVAEGQAGGQMLIAPVSGLSAGEHELLLARPGEAQAFARIAVSAGAALYVLTATDWDDADNSDATMALGELLHTSHPELRITHFVGPYTFTDPMVSAERRTVQADWVKGLRDTYGDEIGLHLHPWCSFVEASGVVCAHQPSSVYTVGDASGYTVRLGAYDRAQMLQMMEYADGLFAQYGLGKPTSFRAGGWTAEIATLQALADDGYTVDSSALNWARMEEWKNAHISGQVEPATLYPWNMAQWSTMSDTSQPYVPSEENIQAPGATPIGLLEIPDNGIMVDYATGQEMIDILHANWPGGALPAPTTVVIGYHPPNFTQGYFDQLDEAMTHYDTLLASQGAGPVVYATMHDVEPLF